MGQNNGNNNGVDLSGALGSSNTGVKFKDSDWSANKYYKEPATPKIIRLVIKYSGGLVKDEKQANYVLLGFVALAIIISLFLIFGIGRKGKEQESFTPEAEAPAEKVMPPAEF